MPDEHGSKFSDEHPAFISWSCHSSGTLDWNVMRLIWQLCSIRETQYTKVQYQFMVMSTWGEYTKGGQLMDSTAVHILASATERLASC